MINFRTGFVSEGHFVSDDWLAAKEYLRGSFVMDLLGTFPGTAAGTRTLVGPLPLLSRPAFESLLRKSSRRCTP